MAQVSIQKLSRNPLVLLGGVVILGGVAYWAWQNHWLDWLFGPSLPPPPPDPDIVPPTIPPLSTTYQLSRVTVSCDDIGITSLQNWRVLLGVRPTAALADKNLVINIVVIDTVTRAEVAHIVDNRLVGSSTSHELITHSMNNDSINNLTPCTLYNVYCWVTNSAGTESYRGLTTTAERTRGCP